MQKIINKKDASAFFLYSYINVYIIIFFKLFCGYLPINRNIYSYNSSCQREDDENE